VEDREVLNTFLCTVPSEEPSSPSNKDYASRVEELQLKVPLRLKLMPPEYMYAVACIQTVCTVDYYHLQPVVLVTHCHTSSIVHISSMLASVHCRSVEREDCGTVT